MTLTQWIKILIKKPALYMPVAWQIIKVMRLKTNGVVTRNYAGDLESILFQERAGWIFEERSSEELHQAFLQLPFETRRGTALDRDAPYSCSNRLVRLVYFVRMHMPSERQILLSEFSSRAASEAQALSSALEYRRATVLFSNHLLQNYCALVLYQTHFKGQTHFVDMAPTIAMIEAWLEKDWDVLFRGSMRLYEGSSSYEILMLVILCNIACSGYASHLATRIREQLVREMSTIIKEYVIDGEIVMPYIGDITPDYPTSVLIMFAETFAFKKNTPYRRLWHEELQALGL
jgi:hypothetical protein